MSKYLLFLSALFLLTCESSERIWSNPNDPDTGIDPSAWAPSNLQAQVLNDSEIKLTWEQEETRIAGFRVERQENSGSFTQIAEVDEDITEYTDTGLEPDIDYTYRVKAFTDENASGYATSNTTNTSFPSPTNLIATPVDDQSIQITWTDNCSFENGFRIERKVNSGSFTQIAEVDEDITEYIDTGLNYGTDYTYRVKAFTDENESAYATSNMTNTSIPSPTNLTATPIDDQSIQLTWVDNCSFESGFRLERSTGGNFAQIAEVGANVTEYTDTGLSIDTDYIYRIKAFTDLNESEYTNTVEMTLFYDCSGVFMGTAIEDIDDNCYETVIIGEQEWTVTNLKVTHYRNGDPIPTGLSDSQWNSTTAGAYAVYDDNETNADTSGYLYNWYAVDDSRNIAPAGWHVPTDDEWQTLVDYLGGSSVAGGKMKETGTEHWNSPNTGATNESGFTALPGGYRLNLGSYYDMGNLGAFWSSTESGSDRAWSRLLNYDGSDVTRISGFKRYGFSVRCIRD